MITGKSAAGDGSPGGHGNNGNGQKSTIQVLIADSDQEHRAALREALTGLPELEVVALLGDGERAARLAAQIQPDIAILDLDMARIDGSSTAESIALSAPTCQLILLSDHSDPATIRRAMQAGAREFLIKPVGEEELLRAINRVHQFSLKRQTATSDDASRLQERAPTGRVFAIWGPKGGVGRTFLAVNLAIAMHTVYHKRVLLVDGCLGFCTADVALDIESKKTIFDLVVDHDEDLDPDLIGRVVVHHSSGLDVLLSPSVENMLIVAPLHLQRMLTVMRRLYDCIVIDTRPLLDETTVAFLDLSDIILTVCNPDLASLRNLRIFLDGAGRLGYSSDKIRMVINRHDMRGAIDKDEIERVCRYHVDFCIANDYQAVANSINHGTPVVLAEPQRPVTRDITHLAEVLLAGSEAKAPSGLDWARKATFARFFGRKAAEQTG